MKTHTLLITGSKAKEFAADVAAVFKGVFQNGEAATISCDERMKRYQLHDKINEALSKSSRTVILNGNSHWFSDIAYSR